MIVDEMFEPSIPPAATAPAGRSREAQRDEPTVGSQPLRRGMARIDAAHGGGLYTMTELWWDPQAREWTHVAGGPGLIEVEASDYAGNHHGEAGQVVRFWEARALGGEVCRFLDVQGGYDGRQKVASFCAHYSGANETTGVFQSVPGCLYSFVQVALDVRCCAGDRTEGDHPGSVALRAGGGWHMYSWANTIVSWAGSANSSWTDLAYSAHNADGDYLGDGVDAILNLRISVRVTPDGTLEFRIVNMRSTVTSVVLAAAVWVTPFDRPPGAVEFGNHVAHEETPCYSDICPPPWANWGDGVWEPDPELL